MALTRRLWGYIALTVAGAAVGVWLVTLWLPNLLVDTRTRDEAAATGGAADGAPGDARRISATLFYVAPGGDGLVAVEQDVVYAQSPADQARRIVERQLGAAPPGHTSAIPAGVTLRALFLTSRGEAYVDVSRDIVAKHPGGSLHEALTVYAIVNAVTVNLPEVNSVQILVDGHEVDTLVGHLDLRHPLRRGTRWVQRTQ